MKQHSCLRWKWVKARETERVREGKKRHMAKERRGGDLICPAFIGAKLFSSSLLAWFCHTYRATLALLPPPPTWAALELYHPLVFSPLLHPFSLSCKLTVTPNPPQTNRSSPRRHRRLGNTASVLPQSELGFTQSTTVCHETSSSHTNTHVLFLFLPFSLSLSVPLSPSQSQQTSGQPSIKTREREEKKTTTTTTH